MPSTRSATTESVRQRLRFDDADDVVEFNSNESPQKIHKHTHLSNGRTETAEETSVSFWIGFSIYLIAMICLLLSFIPPTIFDGLGFAVEDKEGKMYVTWKGGLHIYIIGFLTCLGLSALIALTCLGLSWNIIYYDSLVPGKNPPSPMSPVKIRAKSGHTFHMGYATCILNSVAAFFYLIYWLRDMYI